MTQTTDEKIDKLTTAIEKMIVAPVLPVAPINTQDHDTLTSLVVSVGGLDKKLDDKFQDLKTDIKGIKDGTAATLNDHETRIRKTETSVTQVKTWGTALMIILGIAEAAVMKIFIK